MCLRVLRLTTDEASPPSALGPTVDLPHPDKTGSTKFPSPTTGSALPSDVGMIRGQRLRVLAEQSEMLMPVVEAVKLVPVAVPLAATSDPPLAHPCPPPVLMPTKSKVLPTAGIGARILEQFQYPVHVKRDQTHEARSGARVQAKANRSAPLTDAQVTLAKELYARVSRCCVDWLLAAE